MSTNVFNKAKFIAVTIALMAVVFSFNSCSESTITVTDFLGGSWTISGFSHTTSQVGQQSWEYDKSACGVDQDCEVTRTTSEVFSGSTVTGAKTIDFDEDELCFYDGPNPDFPWYPNIDEEYTGIISTWTIAINEDGTYTVSIAFSGACTREDDPFPDQEFQYSGSVNTSAQTWYMDEAGKNTAIITFMNFPYIDFAMNIEDQCGFGNVENPDGGVNAGEGIVDNDGIAYYASISFRVESNNQGNSMTWKGTSESNTSEATNKEFSRFDNSVPPNEIDCVEDYVRTITKTDTWTFELTK